MKKVKLSQLPPVLSIDNSDKYALLRNSTNSVVAIEQIIIQNKILSDAAAKIINSHQIMSTGNMLTAFSTWTLGPHWMINAEGYLINNTPGSLYGHTTTNNFTLTSGKMYMLSVEITELIGSVSFQFYDGYSSYRSYAIRTPGIYYLSVQGGVVNCNIRVFGNTSDKVAIKSTILSEMNVYDTPLIIATEMKR